MDARPCRFIPDRIDRDSAGCQAGQETPFTRAIANGILQTFGNNQATSRLSSE
jgi:hypothetical protein